MSNSKRNYDKAFKPEAIPLSETSGKSVREIEIDLDITPGLLHKWRGRERRQGVESFPSKGQQRESDAELRWLKRENEILPQERDIPKHLLSKHGASNAAISADLRF